MRDKPDFIDNLDGNTMATALRQLLGANTNETMVVAEPSAQVDEARIATAYFSPSGFGVLRRPLKISPQFAFYSAQTRLPIVICGRNR